MTTNTQATTIGGQPSKALTEARDQLMAAHRAYLATPRHIDVVESMTGDERTAYTFRLLDARLAFRTAVIAHDQLTGRTTTPTDFDWYEGRFWRTTTEQHEHDLVWAATVRDVFDAQLVEARTAALAGRDRPLALLERAADLAEITQCSVCKGDAGETESLDCCHEVVCEVCIEGHNESCIPYFSYVMEA